VTAASVLSALNACADPEQPRNATDAQARQTLDVAEQMASQGDSSDAKAILSPILDSGQYDQLSVHYRHRFDDLLGLTGYWTGDYDSSFAAFKRATLSSEATGDDWGWRMDSAMLLHDFNEVYLSFKVWARTPEKPLAFGQFTMSDRTIADIDQGLGTLPNGAEAQLAFERYLSSHDWRPAPTFSPDVIRLHEAINEIGVGNAARARQIAYGLRSADVLAIVDADKRFDGIVASDPKRFDVHAAAEATLAREREESRQDPDSINLQSNVASDLVALGRNEEALTAVEAILDAASRGPTPGQAPTFVGDCSHVQVQKAYFLFYLGRTDEALSSAAQVGPDCAVKHAQTGSAQLTAIFLINLGRGEEAIAYLRPILAEDLTELAAANVWRMRVCAATQAGDKTLAAMSMALLRDHSAKNPSALVDAQLCVGDLDSAAATVIAGLKDPRIRHLMLAEMQIFRLDGVQTPFEKLLEDRRNVLRKRPDVRAAIEKVGRVKTYDIDRNELY
jgi:tetratricopeptide (TPR) repeat protein